MIFLFDVISKRMRVSATAFTLVAQSVAIILNYKVGQTKNSLEGEGVYIDNL